MLLQSEELAEFGGNFPAYTGTYWPVESAFTNVFADRQAGEMSLLANDFLLLGQEFRYIQRLPCLHDYLLFHPRQHHITYLTSCL